MKLQPNMPNNLYNNLTKYYHQIVQKSFINNQSDNPSDSYNVLVK